MNRVPVLLRWLTRAGVTVTMLMAAATAGAQGQGAAAPAQVPLSGRTAPAGAVVTSQTAVPGVTGSVNTLNPTVLVQGGFGGSSKRGAPLPGPLTLGEALRRGVEYNLGFLNVNQVIEQARGQRTVARSALLPNVTSDLTATRQQVNLAALGVKFSSPIPGFEFPSVVGPFNTFDVRARVSQSVLDLTALNNYRASTEIVKANELSAEDAHNLVVLAIGGSYLQVVAARARVAAGRAQLETANALQQQAQQRRDVGLTAQVDVGRSQVQALTQQQRLITLQTDFAKQKINLARMLGLPPTDKYELGDDVAFAAAPDLSLDDAVKQAQAGRADLKAAEAQVRAAERALAAAKATRLPSVTVNADYGAIGPTFPDAHDTFSIVGKVHVPIWQGGIADGQIQQAAAAARQRRAEYEDLTSQVEGDVRKAYLDLEAAAAQVDVASRNQEVARQTLELTRQRFEAGITDSVEVVQAQESAAVAALDYIDSVFAHNLAKLTVARAIGVASDRLAEFLLVP